MYLALIAVCFLSHLGVGGPLYLDSREGRGPGHELMDPWVAAGKVLPAAAWQDYAAGSPGKESLARACSGRVSHKLLEHFFFFFFWYKREEFVETVVGMCFPNVNPIT